jgi:hypothetical protein
VATPPDTDPPDAPLAETSDSHEEPETREDSKAWAPEDAEAWGGPEEDRDAWQPASPEAWERAAQAAQDNPEAVPIPTPMRRSAHHRSLIKRSNPKLKRYRDPLARGSRRDRRFRNRYGYGWRTRRRRRIVAWSFVLFGLVILGAAASIADAYYQSFKIYQDVKGIQSSLASARNFLAQGTIPPGDPFAVATEVAARAQADVDNARFTFKLTGVLPFFKKPIQAVRAGVAAAGEEAQAAGLMRDIVRDVLGDVAVVGADFQTKASDTPIFSKGVANVELISGLIPRLEEVLQHLEAADSLVRSIPMVPFVQKLDSVKSEALDQSAQAITLVQGALSGVRLLPSFLGAGGTKTYYLAMQNNADQRATGGAVLAFAFIQISNGHLSLVDGGSIGQIDQEFGFANAKLPPELKWYVDHIHRPQAHARLANINFSPDFPVVAGTWSTMLQDVTGQKVDGVIAMDPVAISYLLGKRKVDVPAYPVPITGTNAVAVIENDQYRLPFPDQAAFPGQVIAAAWQIFQDPSPLVRTMKQMALALKERHIQIWSSDGALEAQLGALGWDGALDSGPGDHLYVTDSKLRSNKVDFYTHLSIDYKATIDAAGAIQATCTITVINDTPPDEPRSIAGPNAYGLNAALISLLAPKGAVLSDSDPTGGGLPDHNEGDARVFTREVDVLPGAPRKVTYTYSVPGIVTTSGSGRVYRLTIQHQPMVNLPDLTVSVTLPPGATVINGAGWTVNGNVATYQTTLAKDLVLEITY